jgi:hypothetical protein
MNSTQPLTPAERHNRDGYEKVIHLGVTQFVEVGHALLQIRDRQLYRETHDTFEGYCSEKWSISRAHAYRLCEAATVVLNLPRDVSNLVTNEGQARELAKIPAEKHSEVLLAAGPAPTAKSIREAAQDLCPVGPTKEVAHGADATAKDAKPTSVSLNQPSVEPVSGTESPAPAAPRLPADEMAELKKILPAIDLEVLLAGELMMRQIRALTEQIKSRHFDAEILAGAKFNAELFAKRVAKLKSAVLLRES